MRGLRERRSGAPHVDAIEDVHVLGLAQPARHHVVAGVRATGKRAAGDIAVYALVVLRNTPTGYVPIDSIMTCDPERRGILLPIVAADRDLVVVLDAAVAATTIVPVAPNIPMQAWTLGRTTHRDREVQLLASGRTDDLCS